MGHMSPKTYALFIWNSNLTNILHFYLLNWQPYFGGCLSNLQTLHSKFTVCGFNEYNGSHSGWDTKQATRPCVYNSAVVQVCRLKQLCSQLTFLNCFWFITQVTKCDLYPFLPPEENRNFPKGEKISKIKNDYELF